VSCEHECAFAVTTSPSVFGAGALSEIGEHASGFDLRRVALFTDERLAESDYVATVSRSLSAAGIDSELYRRTRVEPTDGSFLEAAQFAREGRFDGFVSVGGGSVIDTAKAANLFSSHPAELMTYVNRPLGEGMPVPGALAPHIACPTTAGTGSENTGIAVFDLVSEKAKTGIVSHRLRPSLAVIDPQVTRTLPKNVAASGAFDTLCHALESFTARPYHERPRPSHVRLRPSSQGANPWSDIGCRETLSLLGRFLLRGVVDGSDFEAREQLQWASTLAGIAFGNAGCHAPHGMSYSVSGLVRGFRPEGYPDASPIIPHGMSVIVSAPAVFRMTARHDPSRHLRAAKLLGADITGAGPDDAGHVLSARLIELMEKTSMPNGLSGVGYEASDVEALTEGANPQRRLLDNAPVAIGTEELRALYTDALRYW